MSYVKKVSGLVGITVFTLAAAISAHATDIVIEIEPGLYKFDQSASMGPQVIDDKSYEYCLTPDMTKRTINDLVAELQDGGNCSVSNVRHSAGHGEADIICQNQDFGTARGHLSADYTRTSYSVRGNAMIDMRGMKVPLSSQVDAKRVGDCPPGWTPPPGISHK